MKTIYFILMLSSILFTNCNRTTIFYAGFESDAVNSKPNFNPQEAPTGDMIYTSNNCDPSVDDLLVVADPLLGSKALKFSKVDINPNCQYLSFISKNVSTAGNNELWFNWNGIYNPMPADAPIEIWVGNRSFVIGAFRIINEKIYQQDLSANNNYTLIGDLPNGESHSISIHINQATSKWTVSVTKSGGNISSDEFAIFDTNAFTASNFAINFTYNTSPLNSTSSYIIDQINIKKLTH